MASRPQSPHRSSLRSPQKRLRRTNHPAKIRKTIHRQQLRLKSHAVHHPSSLESRIEEGMPVRRIAPWASLFCIALGTIVATVAIANPASSAAPAHLQIDNLPTPLGIDDRTPQF